MPEIHDELEQWFTQIESLSIDRLARLSRAHPSDIVEQRARVRVCRTIAQHALDLDAWFVRDRILTLCELATSGDGRYMDRDARLRLEWCALARLARDVISEEDFALLSGFVDRDVLGSDCRD